MRYKLQFRQTSIVALLVLSMIGIGMQTFETVVDTGCRCATNSLESNADDRASDAAESCCSKTSIESDCCSTTVRPASPCCCNPNATVCECGDCSCSEEKSPHQPIPAIPTNETIQVVTPTLICASARFGFSRPCTLKRLSWPQTFSVHAALSSKQTCVLLSRFTC